MESKLEEIFWDVRYGNITLKEFCEEIDILCNEAYNQGKIDLLVDGTP